MNLGGQRVLVVGMGLSGQAAARLALGRGATVTCTDLREDAPSVPGCTSVYGFHRDEDFAGADLVVVSPGVPSSIQPLHTAEAHGAEIVGELGFAARALEVPLIAVTGTNGKSSTTWFTAQLLEQAGLRPFVGGNLGTPLCDAVDSDCDVAVVEVSSYQLELPDTFHPRVGTILNLAPDHLARHGDLQTYAATKCRLFDQCGPDDWAILPPNEPLLTPHLQGISSRRLYLRGRPGVSIEGPSLRLEGTPDDGTLSLERWALPGSHNLTNAAAAVLLAVCAGARLKALDLASLQPLPHRMEVVHRSDGIGWINDSKATNLHAAKAALSGLAGPLVVLLGGQGKDGADYASLRPLLAERARAIICFGHAGARIADDLEGLPILQVRSLREAVHHARHTATAGDTVLLSPACASFDAFENFEHRGRAFTALAREETP